MTINQIDSTDYPLMPETLPEHSQGHKSAPDGTEDEAQSVMAATTPALLHLATRGTTRAIVTMVVAVRTALFMVAATAAFNFGNFNQAAGSQFSQRLLDRHGVRIEDLDTTAAKPLNMPRPIPPAQTMASICCGVAWHAPELASMPRHSLVTLSITNSAGAARKFGEISESRPASWSTGIQIFIWTDP